MVDLKQKKPLVSIGIPTYNNPEGLRRTLQCMANQTYKEIEVIVSDNCSPGEKVQEVIQEFTEKNFTVQYYRQSENKGPFFNFEFLLKKATGKYFMWAADDDEWDRTFIETGIKALLEDNFYQAWFCSYDIIDTQGCVFLEVLNYPSLTSTSDRRKNIIKYLTAFDVTGKDCMTYAIYERSALVDTVGRYFLGTREDNYGCDSAFNIAFLIKYNILIAEEILFHKTMKSRSAANEKDKVSLLKKNPSYRGMSIKRNTFPPKKIFSILREHYKAVKGTPYTTTVILTIISILPCAIKNYLIIRAIRKFNSVAKRIKALIQRLHKV